MTAPTRHPASGVYRIRLTVPVHLRETTARLWNVRRELTETLGTKDPRDARRLAPTVLDRLQAKLRLAEAEYTNRPVHLSDKDVSALCGRWLAREEARTRENMPERPGTYRARDEFLSDALAGMENDEAFGVTPGDLVDFLREHAHLDDLLAAEGLKIDDDTTRRLARRLAAVHWQHNRDLISRAVTGQWGTSVTSASFPALPSRDAKAAPEGYTLDALLQGWALDRGWTLDAKPIPRALYDRVRTLERLAVFLGHRDASRVTKPNAVAWKAEMLGRGLHVATARNDLSEMSAIWRWGIANEVVSENPFSGLLPPKASKPGRAVRGFTDEEAGTILQAARRERGYLRWLPWVLCATGARLNELCQSAKADVFTVDGVPVIRIHDEGEGRTLKNDDSRRTVPLHPRLIEEGFLAYVAELPNGSDLWPDMRPDKLFGKRSETGGKRVRRWLRGLGITDDRISPNHSWRHTLMTACRRTQMNPEVRSALTGHSAKLDESAGYGEGMGTMMQILAASMAKVALPFPTKEV